MFVFATSHRRLAFPTFRTSTGFSVPALAIRQRAFVRTNKQCVTQTSKVPCPEPRGDKCDGAPEQAANQQKRNVARRERARAALRQRLCALAVHPLHAWKQRSRSSLASETKRSNNRRRQPRCSKSSAARHLICQKCSTHWSSRRLNYVKPIRVQSFDRLGNTVIYL